jgi:hypothetical protein
VRADQPFKTCSCYERRAGALSSHLHLSDPPLTLESLVIDLDVQSKPVQDLFNALVKVTLPFTS